MAASSVTGVGTGSADRKNKGSEHTTLGVEHLIGTRVVACGSVALVGGAATITFPQPLTGSKANYFVFVQQFNSTNAARTTTMTDNVDGNFASFVIAGTGTDTIFWQVVKANVA